MIDYFEDEEGFKKVMAIEIARRDYARALYRSGDLLTQELLNVYFHHQRDNRVFERAAELASQLAHFKPAALKKVAGRPIALTDIEKKNIWLAIEYFAEDDSRTSGKKKSINRALKKLFTMHPRGPWQAVVGRRLYPIKCAATARRIHAEVSRSMKTNEKARVFWVNILNSAQRNLRKYPVAES
jgi:hypothetical protein